jgi:hypothetical protein
MDKETYIEYLAIWDQIDWLLFGVSLGIALIIFLAYKIKYWSAKELKEKHDLASASETKTYIRANYAIAVAIFWVLNAQETETVALSPIWFFIRLFIGFAAATLYGYIASLILNYYYPGPLNKKLKKLRFTPRINPSTGNKMKLLSEDEEDAYLDEGMQAEENVFSVDYDVWIDTQTGETRIEKYKGHLTASECDRCGFQTLRVVKEEIVKEATEFEDGELLKEFKCSYCNRVKRKSIKLTKKLNKDISHAKLIDDPLSYDRRIEMVVVEILTKGEVKKFEFQNILQAKNFLEEFDFEKLEEEV